MFTHDIAFLHLLHEACRNADAEVAFRSISRGVKQAGFCNTEPPANAQPVCKVIEGIQKNFDNKKIHYERGEQDKWYEVVRSTLEQLRSTWERAVEDALSPVIRRFTNKVDTKNLLKITVINEDDCTIMRDAFGRCSKLLHSQPQGLNLPLPLPSEIQAEIDALRNWVASICQRQDRISPKKPA